MYVGGKRCSRRVKKCKRQHRLFEALLCCIIIMHCGTVMKTDEFRMQITVQRKKKKKHRTRTGSRLMSVSARGRVSFFARYRRRPKIGKSRSPPGRVRLFGPHDRRYCSRCLLAAGQFGVQSVVFSLYAIIIFVHYRALCVTFILLLKRDDTFITPSSRCERLYV